MSDHARPTDSRFKAEKSTPAWVQSQDDRAEGIIKVDPVINDVRTGVGTSGVIHEVCGKIQSIPYPGWDVWSGCRSGCARPRGSGQDGGNPDLGRPNPDDADPESPDPDLRRPDPSDTDPDLGHPDPEDADEIPSSTEFSYFGVRTWYGMKRETARVRRDNVVPPVSFSLAQGKMDPIQILSLLESIATVCKIGKYESGNQCNVLLGLFKLRISVLDVITFVKDCLSTPDGQKIFQAGRVIKFGVNGAIASPKSI
ncbi:hypothetical protein DVH05_026979 [Phytophthora capsici]|nr:hypothetical protein DVH05_026979 [Phytophthora capsici]